jgi:phosphoglycerol transferase MdoB-like AlkP superfamily enzyme
MDNITHKSNRYQTYNINYQLILLYRFLLLIALFTISRLGFYYFNTEHYSDMTFGRFMVIMLGGLKFDVSGILFVNGLYILLYHLPLPFRNGKIYSQILKWLFFITNGIALAANVSDFFYFDFILKRSTADVFMFAKEGNILTLFSLFIVDYWQGLVFWVLQMVLLVWGYNKVKLVTEVKPKRIAFYASSLAWLLISVYFTIIGIRGGFTGTTRPITLGNAGAYTQKPLEMAIVLNTPFSIIRTIDKQPLKEKHYFTDEELEQIYTPIHYPADSVGEFKPLNVVVIIMESFAKEYIGAYNRNLDDGEYQGYTPFLDSLIGESKCFQYSFANGRKSIDGLPSVVASIPSMVNPYVTSVYASNEVNSLASTLKQKGYETAFFHGGPNGSMGFDAFMKVAGYDEYFGMTEYGNDDDFDGSWGIWDEEFMLYMADQFSKMKEPFHAAFFSVSSHHPFKVPEKYEGVFKEGTLDFHIPIQYSDLALRKFFEKAGKQPWFKNTLFVLTADHSNHAWHPEYKTSIGDFSVPVLFYHPDNEDFRGMDSVVAQQMDIMPTVLNYLNYDKEYFAFGVNLLDGTSNNFAVNYNNSTYQIIQGNYVLQFLEEKTIGLYDYVNDPLLNTNLVGKLPDIQTKMERLLKAFIQQYNNRMIHNELTVKRKGEVVQ